MIRVGVIGLGSVWQGPYRTEIDSLCRAGRAQITAIYDPNEDKRQQAGLLYDIDPNLASAEAVIGREDVDLVLILASMQVHGELALASLKAGHHVLVEKPIATDLATAAELLELAEISPGHLLPAPHVVLSPTFRAIHSEIAAGSIGTPLSARARYGWAGPWWGEWFYRPGGGSLFDLGVYNVITLCALLGSAKRVTAMVGTAIPERIVDGKPIKVEADDNAHVLLDFGESRYAVITTGFTMQKYRSPAVEIYGSEGTIQMLGDDWAPDGFELWQNNTGAWAIHPESNPSWRWTAGLTHLVEAIESDRLPLIRPEHGYHALEIMLAAQSAGRDGKAREITSAFTAVDFSEWPSAVPDRRARHDSGTTT